VPMPQDLPELFVLRHGETAWNREGRLQGRLDSPLTELGLAQARAMAAALAARGVGPDRYDLVHSPQGRAARTAEAVAEATGLRPRPDARLREIGVGDWAGLSPAEIDARWPRPHPDEPFLDRYACAPGGEPFADLLDRVAGFLAEQSRPAVVVTHGITSRALRAAALGGGVPEMAALPGGQGVIFRIGGGVQTTLAPPLAPAQERG